MNIPLLILSFNQLTFLRNLINWFRYYYPTNDIYIIDNASSYPPLLEYLSDIHDKDNIFVFRFKFNEGSINLKNVIDKRIAENYKYYIISDPDIMPHPSTPMGFLYIFRHCIDNLGYHHAGFCLKIDDLTENKEFIRDCQLQYWEKPVTFLYEGKDYTAYEAPIDTTFALYRSDAGWEYPMRTDWWNKALRVLDSFHLPWYLNPMHNNEEINYYNKTAKPFRCFFKCDTTQFMFQLEQMGFFSYLPDKIIEAFTDLSVIEQFYRFISWERQDLKEKIFKELNGLDFLYELEKKSIDKMIDNLEALKKEFAETVVTFMKKFQIAN